MSSSCSLYVPDGSEIAIKFVLEEAGFDVRSKPKKLNGGGRGMEYDIRGGKDRVSILETPGYSTPDLPETYLLCLAPAKSTEMLQQVVVILKEAGATEQRGDRKHG